MAYPANLFLQMQSYLQLPYLQPVSYTHLSLLKECHQKALEDQREATDDAQLVEWYSNTLIKVVTGNASNIKITNPGDLPK